VLMLNVVVSEVVVGLVATVLAEKPHDGMWG
jgi:hypothetical protein